MHLVGLLDTFEELFDGTLGEWDTELSIISYIHILNYLKLDITLYL